MDGLPLSLDRFFGACKCFSPVWWRGKAVRDRRCGVSTPVFVEACLRVNRVTGHNLRRWWQPRYSIETVVEIVGINDWH